MLVSFLVFQRPLTPSALQSLVDNAISLGEEENIDDEKNKEKVQDGKDNSGTGRWFPSFFPWSPKKVFISPTPLISTATAHGSK